MQLLNIVISKGPECLHVRDCEIGPFNWLDATKVWKESLDFGCMRNDGKELDCEGFEKMWIDVNDQGFPPVFFPLLLRQLV